MNNLFKVYGRLLGNPDLSDDPSFLIPGAGINHIKFIFIALLTALHLDIKYTTKIN